MHIASQKTVYENYVEYLMCFMSLPKHEKYETIYYVGCVSLFEFVMSLLALEMKGLFTEPTFRMEDMIIYMYGNMRKPSNNIWPTVP